MNQLKSTGVNLFGCGYWGSKIKAALIEMGVDVNVIDPTHNKNIPNRKWPAIIATPTNTHYDLALKLIKEGYDVLIEKPVATSHMQIMELKHAKQSKQVVMAGHLYMYNPMFAQFKSVIKELGKPKFIHCVRTNFGRYQTDTDVLHNISFHDFSIIQNLFRTINITQSIGFKLSNDTNIDRALVIGNADGVAFQIEGSWLDAKRKRTVTFYGDLGQATWDSDTDSIEVTKFTIVPFEKTTYNVLPKDKNDTLKEELSHFIECVEHRLIPNTTLFDAMQIELLINNAITNRN